MIFSLGIISFAILQSISIIHFFVMLILELEVNLLPIVLLGQPVFQHCFPENFIVFHVDAVGYDCIGFVYPQAKVAKVSKVFQEILPNLWRLPAQLYHIVVLFIKHLPQLFVPLLHKRYRGGLHVHGNDFIVWSTAAINLLHVLLKILLSDLFQLVFFEFLFLVALAVIDDLFAADVFN